jgi:homoserine/homoserine lactone efflux protein
MTLDHWLAFVAASAILLAIPGPTVLLVIAYALGHGRKAAAAIVAGVALGDFTAMTASMLGLGALLASSASAFGILRLAGAAYLVYLGVRLWLAPVEAAEARATEPTRPWRMFAHAYAVTALNPKGIVFFVAFVPQFLVAGQPLLGQIVLLEATFLVMASANALSYALVASSARGALRDPSTRRGVNRVGGSLLIGVGVLAAGWRRIH